MKFLPDTSVFRESGKDEQHMHVGAWFAAQDDVDLAISTITVREVRKGIMKLRSRKPAVADEPEPKLIQS